LEQNHFNNVFILLNGSLIVTVSGFGWAGLQYQYMYDSPVKLFYKHQYQVLIVDI